MKRKAMLMGMAVMTGLPSWAVAKGTGGNTHPYSSGREVQVTPDRVESEALLPKSDETGTAAASPEMAAELLAQIKSVLRYANFGTVTRPTADNQGWKLELLARETRAFEYGDPRLSQVKPMGLALRLRF